MSTSSKKPVDGPALAPLREALETYAERRGTYGPSEQVYANLMVVLFPKGLFLQSQEDWVRFGLFSQVVGKLARYARDFHEPHLDSIHDMGVYAFMLEGEDRKR